MTKQPLIDVDYKHLALVEKILKEQVPLSTVWVYGSRVTWTADQRSDLDLVLFNAEAGHINDLKEAFAESDLPFSVDVMDWNKIPESFKKKIEEKYVVVQEKPEREGWRACKLGEVVTLHYGKALKAQDRIVGKFPVYSSAGLTGYHNEPLTNSKGLIVGRKGTIGKIYYSPTPFCCIDTAYYILPEDDKYHFNFLYYLLQILGLDELNEDSAVPGLNRETAYSQNIILPPLPEQRTIASVLSSLDDKIDLLHRQNKTLEDMAETLFRQWFVEEADEGWEQAKLSDIATFFNGKSRPSEEGNIPIYGGNGILGYTNISNYSGTSIIIGRVGAYCGSLYFENREIWVSDNALLVRAKKINQNYFLFYLLKTLELNSMAEGSSHPLLTQTLLKSIAINLPPKEMVVNFEYQLEQWIKKNQSNQVQIRTLQKLRDMLLPKLMSGEVGIAGG